MRKIKDVLRLHAAGRSARQIGPSVGVSRSTVADYLRRAEVAGLYWPLPDGLDEEALERRLFALVDVRNKLLTQRAQANRRKQFQDRA